MRGLLAFLVLVGVSTWVHWLLVSQLEARSISVRTFMLGTAATAGIVPLWLVVVAGVDMGAPVLILSTIALVIGALLGSWIFVRYLLPKAD